MKIQCDMLANVFVDPAFRSRKRSAGLKTKISFGAGCFFPRTGQTNTIARRKVRRLLKDTYAIREVSHG